MIGNELMYRRNLIIFFLVSIFYSTQVTINISIEGWASVFPPAYLFIFFEIILLLFIYKKVNPKITMYIMLSFMYIYFYFLLKESPYLVNYLFMWLGLSLSALYQSSRVVLLAGGASTILTFYAFFSLRNEIFPNVGNEDFIYLILFGVFETAFLLIFINKIKKTKTKLQQLAYRDPLTGAANRLLLKKKFDLLKDSKAQSIGFLFIDMNGFKKINDTYGHEVGDLLLERVASRLNGVLRDTDLLCRLGGDEFVILSSNIDIDKLEGFSKQIQSAVEEPMNLNHLIINVSASIGYTYTTDVLSSNLDNLIKDADRAMYRDKGNELLGSQYFKMS